MTDRTDHRAAAELMLADADEWARQAGELSPKASERACLDRAQVHALLAIHDALTAADRYAANEAKQREAEPDPLDEDDHRDRLDRHGDIWVRNPRGCFHTCRRDCRDQGCKWTLDFLNWHYGPLTFAPDAAPDTDGAPSVTAPVADDPGDDAVDGEEGERRNLNAQTTGAA